MLRIGIGIMALGVLSLLGIIQLATATADNAWLLSPILAVYGAGMGIFLARFFTTVLSDARPHEYGSASASLNSVQQFSGSLGVAVLGTIYFAAVPHAPTSTEPLATTLIVTVAALVVAIGAVWLLPRSSLGGRS